MLELFLLRKQPVNSLLFNANAWNLIACKYRRLCTTVSVYLLLSIYHYMLRVYLLNIFLITCIFIILSTGK